MATWSLSTQYKKSSVEKMFFFKDGKVITIEQGFRWATFKVDSDERPLTDEELVNEDGYELSCIANDNCWEMWDMTDGCWLDIDAGNDKTTVEDIEAFSEAWEEDCYEGVEALGWSQDECEYYYHGPLCLTNEDTGEEFKGEPDEELTVQDSPDLTFAEKLEIIQEIEEEKSLITPWYPASIKPYRVGTYQYLETEMEVMWPFASNVQPAVWDGKKWDKKNVVMWRGLTEDPNQ